jgi:hypothetical protein
MHDRNFMSARDIEGSITQKDGLAVFGGYEPGRMRNMQHRNLG